MKPLNYDNVCKTLHNLHELLECYVCREYMTSPIYQCNNGHTICSACKPKLHRKCPICQDKVPDVIRCRTLEKVADSLVVKCENKKYGCPHIVTYNTRLAHGDSCNFRPYRCPLQKDGRKCEADGDIPFIVSHLMDCHEALMLDDCSFQLQCVVPNPRASMTGVTIISRLGRYFYLHTQTYLHWSVPSFMAFISLIGNEEDTEGYKYRLEVRGEGWRSVYEGRPCSFRDIDLKGRPKTAGCLIVLGTNVSSSGETGKAQLDLTARIWKTQAPERLSRRRSLKT